MIHYVVNATFTRHHSEAIYTKRHMTCICVYDYKPIDTIRLYFDTTRVIYHNESIETMNAIKDQYELQLLFTRLHKDYSS